MNQQNQSNQLNSLNPQAQNNLQVQGKIHSIESFSTMDGPGMRAVVFLQGCPLRCKFCHNIDCAINEGGELITVEKLVEKLKGFSDYWKNDPLGGITLTGGDPVFQPDFVYALVTELKKNNINVVLDTSLFTDNSFIDRLINDVQLWMVSIKMMDEEKHKDLTTISNKNILENIKYLTDKTDKLRIRYLLIPGITDTAENLTALCEFVKSLKGYKEVEIQKYWDQGAYKWKEIFGKYELEGVRNADEDDVRKVKDFFIKNGIRFLM